MGDVLSYMALVKVGLVTRDLRYMTGHMWSQVTKYNTSPTPSFLGEYIFSVLSNSISQFQNIFLFSSVWGWVVFY